MAVNQENILKKIFGTDNPVSIMDLNGSNNGTIVREGDAQVTQTTKKEPPKKKTTTEDRGKSL